MGGEILGRRHVVNDPVTHGGHHAQVDAVLQRLVPEQHLRIAREEVFDDALLGVPDDGGGHRVDGEFA